MNVGHHIAWLFLTYTLACFLVKYLQAVSLHNCGGSNDDKFAEVVHGSTNTTFTCSLNQKDWANTIEWKVNNAVSASCDSPTSPTSNADTCVGKTYLPVFNPRRTTTQHSVMTINTTQLKNDNIFVSGTLTCKDININMEDCCRIDYITPAFGTCSTHVVTSTSPWRIDSSCNITEGNSSRGRYACQWSARQQEDEMDSWTSNWINMTSNMLPGGEAHCSLALPLRFEDGHYAYKVKLRPGRRFVQAGSITLTRPTTPLLTCTQTSVADNISVSCTCTVDCQPAGRVQWVKGSCNRFDTRNPLVTGTSPLVLRRQETRADLNVAQFRCDVTWSDEVFRSEIYNASVEETTPASCDATNMPYLHLAVGFGVLSAVLIVLITVILLWLWRHQWMQSCARKQDIHTSQPTAAYKRGSPTEAVQLESIASPSGLEASTSPYEFLNVADIGQGSEYSEIIPRKRDNAKATAADDLKRKDSSYQAF